MFKVGFRRGIIEDPVRRDWADKGPRPIRWSAWYPTNSGSVETQVLLPSHRPLFLMGEVACDAPLADHPAMFPVVLLSHGTGGTACGLGWLARGLAASGHVVIGVDHHGNTASERYRAEGFLCWWERPRDLTVTLDRLTTGGPFAGRLHLGQVSVAGFSLGGYTVLALLGAITQMRLFEDFARHRPFGRGPREFPDLVDRIEPLFESSPVFRASWERQSASMRDTRVEAGFVCAPAPTVRAFTVESLGAIKAPVAMVVGEADREAPAQECAEWLQAHLPDSTLDFLGAEVGHYVFLCEGTALGRNECPDLWADPPGVDRAALHARVVCQARHVLAR